MYDKVKDKVTGFSGVILARCEYATGCSHYGVCPERLTKEGKSPEWEYIDESRLVLLGKFQPFKGTNPKDPSPGPTPSQNY